MHMHPQSRFYTLEKSICHLKIEKASCEYNNDDDDDTTEQKDRNRFACGIIVYKSRLLHPNPKVSQMSFFSIF